MSELAKKLSTLNLPIFPREKVKMKAETLPRPHKKHEIARALLASHHDISIWLSYKLPSACNWKITQWVAIGVLVLEAITIALVLYLRSVGRVSNHSAYQRTITYPDVMRRNSEKRRNPAGAAPPATAATPGTGKQEAKVIPSGKALKSGPKMQNPSIVNGATRKAGTFRSREKENKHGIAPSILYNLITKTFDKIQCPYRTASLSSICGKA
ncbi:unnamed protein product [Dovyalis caffra]|uniref:Uncharacterized protein n=1 Tax=Dovyalis caffra TaxID=77055 RepID=A0AAV1REC5_9ROSI|nr:unnamed protein product [Dovyalis caffra]